MSRNRIGLYLAAVVAGGGLLIAGVPTTTVLLMAFFGFMVSMHLGGHGGHGGGHGGTTGPGADRDLVAPPKNAADPHPHVSSR